MGFGNSHLDFDVYVCIVHIDSIDGERNLLQLLSSIAPLSQGSGRSAQQYKVQIAAGVHSRNWGWSDDNPS